MKLNLSNKVYDILKWVAQVVLPALGTLYFGLSQIWSWPASDKVIGTITAVDAFLGLLLGFSSYSYDGDGTITVDMATGDTDFSLNTEEFSGPSKMVSMKIVKMNNEDQNGSL